MAHWYSSLMVSGPIHVADRDVDDALDRELRSLLSTCFTGPHNACFAERRYFKQPPQQRWLLRDGDQLLAHVALHEKTIGTVVGDLAIGGIAEVCVKPDHRGRGHVRTLMAAADAWMAARGIPFGMLFGGDKVYGSSGYRKIANPIRHLKLPEAVVVVEAIGWAMVKPLANQSWPEGEIDLHGPVF
jgi:GNAT superfamily N-acetyltransferase